MSACCGYESTAIVLETSAVYAEKGGSPDKNILEALLDGLLASYYHAKVIRSGELMSMPHALQGLAAVMLLAASVVTSDSSAAKIKTCAPGKRRRVCTGATTRGLTPYRTVGMMPALFRKNAPRARLRRREVKPCISGKLRRDTA